MRSEDVYRGAALLDEWSELHKLRVRIGRHRECGATYETMRDMGDLFKDRRFIEVVVPAVIQAIESYIDARIPLVHQECSSLDISPSYPGEKN